MTTFLAVIGAIALIAFVIALFIYLPSLNKFGGGLMSFWGAIPLVILAALGLWVLSEWIDKEHG